MIKAPPHTMLIVDDIEVNREILDLQFQNDFHTVQCENGLDALSYIRRHEDEICAVLLDVVMPVMGAGAFLGHILEEKLIEGVPVFIVTAQTDERINLEGHDSRVTDILEKPFRIPFLKKRVTSQVELFLTRRSLELNNLKDLHGAYLRAMRFARLNLRLISALNAAIEFRDLSKCAHATRMRAITREVYRKLRSLNAENCGSMSDADIEAVAYASLFHDVGKIFIPDPILKKPSRLTDAEYAKVKEHARLGADFIALLNPDLDHPILSKAYEICLHHHERVDGRGYPDGLRGSDIPLCAQVAGLADVFDALTEERCYKKASTTDEALGLILHGQCGAFNPSLLGVFVSLVREIDFKADPLDLEGLTFLEGILNGVRWI